jgi:hypothetical protein
VSKPCGRTVCGHPKNRHDGWGRAHPGACREKGCPCVAYLPTGQRELL